MFHHPHDTRLTIIAKHLAALTALATVAVVAVYAVLDDTKIPQREITLLLDVKDSINVCLPEDDSFGENSFFNF